jgi:hypothetical protein
MFGQPVIERFSEGVAEKTKSSWCKFFPEAPPHGAIGISMARYADPISPNKTQLQF